MEGLWCAISSSWQQLLLMLMKWHSVCEPPLQYARLLDADPKWHPNNEAQMRSRCEGKDGGSAVCVPACPPRPSCMALRSLARSLSSSVAKVIPGNVTVHIWEGKRDHNLGTSSGKPWGLPLSSQVCSVPHCDRLKVTVCNIGNIPVDSDYKVRVGAFTDQSDVSWTIKQSINIRRSRLIAPTFTLSSTSNSVRVQIHRKQILKEIFTNGVKYTIYLWPTGQKNQKHVSVWKPMIIECDQVEIVTDKGWIIISNSADTKNRIVKDSERRGSLDSGVSVEHLSISSVKTEEENREGQVDSGCGSLKGTEGSGNMSIVSRQRSTYKTHKNKEEEDSGLGLSHHEGSLSLKGEDTGLLNEVEVKNGYQSQSPSSVDVLNDTDSNMAAPSAGYRSGQVTCTCTEHEYCMWCKFKNSFTQNSESETQPLTDFRQMPDAHLGSSSYSKETSLMETVTLLNMEVQMMESVMSEKNCAESSVILCSCPLQDITHTGSFTLQNMELTFS
ncbi:hypothetical protein Baya_14216 [Bagarius yarrelli]|uniref:Interleukin-6 receptor subunit beta n=1 Tax=Bagarius yarrelli TaxID=175774 RepID=A0A556V836_BAGYA|nr:hypothetical protein Baya_14216 [Bagarius yarrelli]